MATCFLHPSDKAVATCGNCNQPICRRCTLHVDDIAYCSPECLNALNAPSAPNIPIRGMNVSAGGSVLDEVSEIVMKTQGDKPSAASEAQARAALSEPSITMSAYQADGPAVMAKSAARKTGPAPQSGAPVPALLGDASTPAQMKRISVPGTARGMLSSSCFFHPDTSAIVRCVKCRNPICSLCAEETTEGLMCSPSCGVPDPVGDQQRRSFKLVNLAVVAALLIVSVESVLLFHSIRDARSQEGKVSTAPTLEQDLESATGLLRDAEALLHELPTEAGAALPQGAALAAAGTKLDSALLKLGQVRELCTRWLNHVSDAQPLEQRMAAQQDLTKQLEAVQDRLRVPRALLQAGTLCDEAAAAAASKLREARKVCVSVGKEAPDAAVWQRQLKEIDDQLDALEARFPSLKASR